MKIRLMSVEQWQTGNEKALLTIFAGEDNDKAVFDKEGLATAFFPAVAMDDFSGKKGEILEVYPPAGNTTLPPVKKAAFIGLGKSEERVDDGECRELFRCTGGDVAALCQKREVACLAVFVPVFEQICSHDFIEHFIEGIFLGLYRFEKYKTALVKEEAKEEYDSPEEILLLVEKESALLEAAVARGERAAKAAITARNMANEPGNMWTPSHFAAFAEKLGTNENVSCTVLGKDDLKKLAMGGILGVNQGSAEEPKLVIVDYIPQEYKETVLFVGKGLTFDSGGISLKPGAGMMDMKYDMCGGAAAISAMEAIIAEKPAVRVVCLVPSTDNMPGGRALKPGDVVTHYGGITAEIENTDAEGRLILADALAYGVEQYRPDAVIDLATLTGAVIIGLGHHYVGTLSNNDELCNAVMSAASRAGEKQWRLPLDALYAKQIESRVADIKNTGGRPAGTITAAEYLHKFVGETPWVHLDIAGTAWDYSKKSYVPKGPSGIGTRTLIEFIRAKEEGRK